MANKEKKQFKEDFLEATVELYKEIGEAVPYGIVTEMKYDRKIIIAGLQDLFDDRKLMVLVNPYGTNEDFIGVYGKRYPMTMDELNMLRKNIKELGVTEARKLLT